MKSEQDGSLFFLKLGAVQNNNQLNPATSLKSAA